MRYVRGFAAVALLALGSHTALAQNQLGLYSPANPEDKAINLSSPRNDKIQRGIEPGQAPYTNSMGQVTAPANARAGTTAQAGVNTRDPNHWRFRYANNQWWYYQTNNRWVVWQNGNWQEPRAASHQPQASQPVVQQQPMAQPTLAQPAMQPSTEQPRQTGYRGTTLNGTQTNDGPAFGSQPTSQSTSQPSPTRNEVSTPDTATPGAPQASDSQSAADRSLPQN